MARQQLAQRDSALDAFGRLRVREVRAKNEDTVATFLAKFQSAAADLKSDERIRLEMANTHESGVELLKAVLADPQASKICALHWEYGGKESVSSIVPLLANSCPELASLRVNFSNHSVLDFVASVLEHPSNKVKVLEMPKYTKGDLTRFFAALGQSQVSAITVANLDSPEFSHGLCDYLAKDLLVRLHVLGDNKQVPSEVMMSLAACTCLTVLRWDGCQFSQPTAFTHLPKSIAKLVFDDCRFVGGFDWSFLANGSGLQELEFLQAQNMDGFQLGSALAVRLKANGLDKLRLGVGGYNDGTLAVVGMKIDRIKRLDIGNLNNASVELIALALQSPNSEMKELVLGYYGTTASVIKSHLVPALRHPNCNLNKLSFYTFAYKEAADTLEDKFRDRLALFVLLQGQQVRRRSLCALRRLPVEMFRLVGEVLM